MDFYLLLLKRIRVSTMVVVVAMVIISLNVSSVEKLVT